MDTTDVLTTSLDKTLFTADYCQNNQGLETETTDQDLLSTKSS